MRVFASGSASSTSKPGPPWWAEISRTCAEVEAPKVIRRRRESRACERTRASSALATAVAPSRSAWNSSPFAYATPSIDPVPSRWTGPTLVTTPTSGSINPASRAISPRWFIPASITA